MTIKSSASSINDQQLASSLVRDLLFRRFCRLELSSDIPDATTLERFRQQLVDHDLWEKLLGEVNRQLEEKHIIMTEDRVNIVDATPVEAAQSGPGKGIDGNPTKGMNAGWHVKQDSRGKLRSIYCHSVHTRVDKDAFIPLKQ